MTAGGAPQTTRQMTPPSPTKDYNTPYCTTLGIVMCQFGSQVGSHLVALGLPGHLCLVTFLWLHHTAVQPIAQHYTTQQCTVVALHCTTTRCTALLCTIMHQVQHGWSEKYEPGMERASKDQAKLAVIDEYKQQQNRHERGSPYYALKWGIGETPGIYDAGNGYWNQTCTGPAHARVCTARPHVLYAHPFNDPSLPLSFWKFDPKLRECLRSGEKPPCRYNHRLLPNPALVPHDLYSRGARRWSRKQVVPGVVPGEWLPDEEVTALLDGGTHSQCYIANCKESGPEASIDGDPGSHFAMAGPNGFVTYDFGKCVKVVQMMYISSDPCDLADAREFRLEAGASKAGPWTALTQYKAECNAKWSVSPTFLKETRYLKLNILANNGYSGGTRLPEVSFFGADERCTGS